MRAGFSIFLHRILLVLVFFGAIRGSIISRAGITVSAMAGFRAAPLRPAFWLFFSRYHPPLFPRHPHPLERPPYICHMTRWRLSALQVLVLVRLLLRRPCR